MSHIFFGSKSNGVSYKWSIQIIVLDRTCRGAKVGEKGPMMDRYNVPTNAALCGKNYSVELFFSTRDALTIVKLTRGSVDHFSVQWNSGASSRNAQAAMRAPMIS